VEEERKIVSQSVRASERQNDRHCKDHCTVRHDDDLHIHSGSPGTSTQPSTLTGIYENCVVAYKVRGKGLV